MSDDQPVVAPQAPRNPDGTLTVPTIDHGDVTLSCPAWCVAGHSYPRGVAQTDICHEGEPVWALSHTEEYGESGHAEVSFAQWPFSSRPDTVLSVEAEDGNLELGPAGARKVAQAFRKHADTIDLMADQLDGIRGAGR